MAVTLPTGRRGQALALGLLALLLAVIWLAIAAPVVEWHTARAERLDQRRILADRMQAAAGTLPQLRRDAAGLTAAAPATLLEGGSDAIAGAALQAQLDRMAAAAGVTLSSIELLPAEPAGAYRRVPLRITLGGPWPALVSFLQATAQASPRMLADDLQIQPAMSVAAPGAQAVGASLTIFAFRAGPP